MNDNDFKLLQEKYRRLNEGEGNQNIRKSRNERRALGDIRIMFERDKWTIWIGHNKVQGVEIDDPGRHLNFMELIEKVQDAYRMHMALKPNEFTQGFQDVENKQ